MTLDEALKPLEAKVEAAVPRATNLAVEAIKQAYGAELRSIHLFGSRARGDHRPFSDVDLAVVIEREMDDRWPEMSRLVDLLFPIELDTGVRFHAWPLGSAEWSDPEQSSAPHLVRRMKRDAKALA
jgi:predicted nucleotidyltransferase